VTPEARFVELERLGGGVDLQRRHTQETRWPCQWRARLFFSRQRWARFRITVFAETAEAAIDALAAEVERVAEERRKEVLP